MNDEKVSHTEAVLAFIHEAKTWRDMDTDERAEWCRRVAYVLSDESNGQFGEWSQTGIAPILGIAQSVLSERLAWSRRVFQDGPDRTPKSAYRHRDTEGAKRFFSNPAVVGERKAEIIAQALEDEYVAEQVAEAIGRDAMLTARLERARKQHQPQEPATRQQRKSIHIDDWRNWTAAEQEEFDAKTVRSARHLLQAAFIRSQGYVASGEAEMLLNLLRPSDLDAELDDLLSTFRESS